MKDSIRFIKLLGTRASVCHGEQNHIWKAQNRIQLRYAIHRCTMVSSNLRRLELSDFDQVCRPVIRANDQTEIMDMLCR